MSIARTYHEAMQDPVWKDVMDAEMDVLASETLGNLYLHMLLLRLLAVDACSLSRIAKWFH